MFSVITNIGPNKWITICTSECPEEARMAGEDYSLVTGNDYEVVEDQA